MLKNCYLAVLFTLTIKCFIQVIRKFSHVFGNCEQDFGDSRDADDARHYLNGRTFDGSRIVVEFAKRVCIYI